MNVKSVGFGPSKEWETTMEPVPRMRLHVQEDWPTHLARAQALQEEIERNDKRRDNAARQRRIQLEREKS